MSTTDPSDADASPWTCSICDVSLDGMQQATDHVTSQHPERLTEAVRGVMMPRD